MITIALDKKTKRFMKQLDGFERRWRTGLGRFTYHFAAEVKRRVEASGSRTGVDYAKLEVRWFQDLDGYNSFAVLLPESARELTADEVKIHALYVLPAHDDPKLGLLAKYSPWPADMIPFVPGPSDAQLVSRKVSAEEIAVRTTDLQNDSELITQMKGLGLEFNTSPRASLGAPVSEDLAWTVLRHEFGLQGEPMVQHWRKSLKAGDDSRLIHDLTEGFLKWVVEGDARGLAGAEFKSGSDAALPVIFRFQDGLGAHGRLKR